MRGLACFLIIVYGPILLLFTLAYGSAGLEALEHGNRDQAIFLFTLVACLFLAALFVHSQPIRIRFTIFRSG
jgi:hypothetical protein